MPGAGGKLLCVLTYALVVHVKAPGHPQGGASNTAQIYAPPPPPPPPSHVCETPDGCPAGHGATLGSDSYGCAHYSCTRCPAFTANNDAFGVCTNCFFAGKIGIMYAPEGSATCLSCTDPTREVNAQQTDCVLCAADKIRQNGADRCTSCPDGQHLLAGTCQDLDCSDNQIKSGNICTDCIRGMYVKDNQCVWCERGTFNAINTVGCVLCPVGYTTTFAGVVHNPYKCFPCAAGQTSNDERTACRPCTVGTYSSEGSACTVCDIGSTSAVQSVGNVNDDACIPCDFGFTTSAGGSICHKSECPSGQYSPIDQWSMSQGDDKICHLCPYNTINANEESTEVHKCTPCDTGRYANDARTECIQCTDAVATTVFIRIDDHDDKIKNYDIHLKELQYFKYYYYPPIFVQGKHVSEIEGNTNQNDKHTYLYGL